MLQAGMAMFMPRGRSSKRTNVLPQVRIDDEEKQAVDALVAHLSQKVGVEFTVSDVIRIALGRLHEAELGTAKGTGKKARRPAASGKET